MNRRNFIKMIGGVLAACGIGKAAFAEEKTREEIHREFLEWYLSREMAHGRNFYGNAFNRYYNRYYGIGIPELLYREQEKLNKLRGY